MLGFLSLLGWGGLAPITTPDCQSCDSTSLPSSAGVRGNGEWGRLIFPTDSSFLPSQGVQHNQPESVSVGSIMRWPQKVSNPTREMTSQLVLRDSANPRLRRRTDNTRPLTTIDSLEHHAQPGSARGHLLASGVGCVPNTCWDHPRWCSTSAGLTTEV